MVTIANTLNFFMQGFFVVMYSDLEIDYINPIDLCNKLNPYILPEAALQACVCVFLLLTGYWLSFILCLPVLVFNAYTIRNNQHLLDATEIFKTLSKHKRAAFMKLIYHLILFFYFLFYMIISIIDWVDDEN